MASEKWVDLNIDPVGYCKHRSVNDALEELARNAIDANPPGVTPIFTAGDSTAPIVIKDHGDGLPLSSFILGHSAGASKVAGQFGVGLKDAVAILMREKATVDVRSAHGCYRFKVSVGQFGIRALHVQRYDNVTRVLGTCIEVTGIKNAQKIVEDVKERFRCWSDLESVFTHGSVNVYKCSKKGGGQLFLKGVAIKLSQDLHFAYDFTHPTKDQFKASDRDHNIEGKKFKTLFQEPIQRILLALSKHEQKQHAPPKPSYEFAWPAVRECFGYSVIPSLSKASHASSEAKRLQRELDLTVKKLADATNERARLCHKLKELSVLPTLDCSTVKPFSNSSDAAVQLTSVNMKRNLDNLIQRYSRHDVVPHEHKSVVEKIQKVFQQNALLSVSSVYPGGSYAKGTTIGDSSDVDLLVVLNGIPSENHEQWLYLLLANLRVMLEQNLPGECCVVRTTRYALQLRINSVNVDVLPVPSDIWNSNDRQSVIDATPPRERRWLSVAFAKEQVDFVKKEKKTAGVTGIIRLVKRWVKASEWYSKSATPKSYCIELLIIHVVQQQHGAQDKLKIIHEFWKLVRSPLELKVTLEKIPHQDIADERPLVLDPANNTNNVANAFKWHEWQKYAEAYCSEKGLIEFIGSFPA